MAHPTRLGKYAIEGVLGTGAMGTVYEATDPGIQRRVALKTIRRSLVDSDGSGVTMATRFRNEAQAAGRLSHPGIVAIYEYGEDGDTAFIAMEFVEGQDLGKILSANPIMSEPMLLQVMDQLLAALDYAHERGVWHRDIKPANLIFTRTGQLKITDFGVARIRDAALTQITSMVGTHGYMSPEQYRGEAIDHRVDIFAAGVLLYRLLVGQAAFAGASPEAIMYKVLHEEPPAPSTVGRVARSIQMDQVVNKALAKHIKDRYATAGAFREALHLHAAKSASGNPVIGAALHWDETVVDEQAAQLLRQVAHRSTSGGGWDEGALSTLERALASFVGPLAKLLVKQAAAQSGDYDTLVEAVAQHLHSADERSRFMAKLNQQGTSGTGSQGGSLGGRASVSPSVSGGSVGGKGSLGSAASGGASQASSTSGSGMRAVTPAFVAHAQRVLTLQMGPMAKVVVKKAESQSADLAQFIELLLAHSADGVDRAALRNALLDGLDGDTKA
jgi:predicted Ser/Thr protein kinase